MPEPSPTLSTPFDWSLYLTSRQVGSLLNLSPIRVRELRDSGKLAAIQLPNNAGFMYLRSQVVALAEARAAARQAKAQRAAL
jgi:hypothetical protein